MTRRWIHPGEGVSRCIFASHSHLIACKIPTSTRIPSHPNPISVASLFFCFFFNPAFSVIFFCLFFPLRRIQISFEHFILSFTLVCVFFLFFHSFYYWILHNTSVWLLATLFFQFNRSIWIVRKKRNSDLWIF